MIRVATLVATLLVAGLTGSAGEIPANTWVRIADCPGDAEGREVPPGRAATWCYAPPLKAFVRYGGYTPRFSNAVDKFDPATKKWTRLVAEDENYPLDRPGGGCRWAMAYDPRSKLVLIGGGAGNGYTGSRGVWGYDPKSGKFTSFSRNLPKGAVYGCFDTGAGVFVAQQWPKSSGLGQGITMMLTLADRKWHRLSTPKCPQPQWGGHVFPMIYHGGIRKIVLLAADAKKKGAFAIWTFDAAGKKWAELKIDKGPAYRRITAVAYDPAAKLILMHGGSDGKRAEKGTKEDTWVLDLAKKEWKEVKTTGPPPMKGIRGRSEILFRQALAYDSDGKQFLFSDPDLGVWAFRYDPEAAPGKAAVTGGFVPRVCGAASNPPPEIPAEEKEELKEKRLKLPSDLNKRITAMPDNSALALGGGRLPGNEVGWCYDSDAGVMIKYGGCGNWSCPFWTGYGSPLILYDPGTERWYTRRVAEISGARRPGNGCTRSVAYDSARKVTWIVGSASSGPYDPGSKGKPLGVFCYDLKRDRFIEASPRTRRYTYPEGVGCVLQFSPDHKLCMVPDKGKTWHLDSKTGKWSAKTTPGSPGHLYVYQRMAYLKSKKAFLCLGIKGPAPKKGEKDTRVNGTYAYDPAAGKWTDLNAKSQPPTRVSKYGLTYDSRNDVVVLVGGQRGWNKGPHKDLWVYHVKKNLWEKMAPKPAPGSKGLPVFDYTLATAYDSRHNAVIFSSRNGIWAYRYKK